MAWMSGKNCVSAWVGRQHTADLSLTWEDPGCAIESHRHVSNLHKVKASTPRTLSLEAHLAGCMHHCHGLRSRQSKKFCVRSQPPIKLQPASSSGLQLQGNSSTAVAVQHSRPPEQVHGVTTVALPSLHPPGDCGLQSWQIAGSSMCAPTQSH